MQNPNLNIQTINDTISDLEKSDIVSLHIGLNEGLMGVSLFFFYYSRFIEDETYEDIAYNLLERVLEKIDIGQVELNYASGISGIASCIDFLIKERFLEIESEDFFEDIDHKIFVGIQASPILDCSFQTGITGLCSYFIHHYEEVISKTAIKATLDKLCSVFSVPEYVKHPINTLFLAPSEILQDIKLLLRRIKQLDLFMEQTTILYTYIEKFERLNYVLQSNCYEYYKIQYLRESIGFENNQITEKMIVNNINGLSDRIIRGISYMYFEKPTLPNIWKIL